MIFLSAHVAQKVFLSFWLFSNPHRRIIINFRRVRASFIAVAFFLLMHLSAFNEAHANTVSGAAKAVSKLNAYFPKEKLNILLFSRGWEIICISLLILVTSCIFYVQELRNKVNRRLLKEKERSSHFNQFLKVEKKSLIEEKQALETENEWLLNEVHHRVKNNLQIVVSLLESQASFLKGDALKAVTQSYHRVYALALIHQQIYADGSNQKADFSKFLQELVRYLEDNPGLSQSVSFHCELGQVKVAQTKAIPLAIIANEIITNSLQHAFPSGSIGEINITMTEIDGAVSLEIADNGSGSNLDINMSQNGSLGMTLIQGLARDIDATIEVRSAQGTVVNVNFRLACPNEVEKTVGGKPIILFC
ncbi:sensor histidine kinase [Pedobacter jamesrossensis]|uniref:histidine kinase n=1 Tax=Pedobacter jamesrossensis TaxID=1908238 RepID=A0ABV8NKX3_9SPHI